MTESAVPSLEGIHNFRELAPYPLRGGGHIRPGMVYRSGALERMTAADLAWLREHAGVRTVLDLRHPDELQGAEPHGLADRVTALSFFPEEQTQESLIAELNGLYGTGPSAARYLHYLTVAGDRIARAVNVFAEEAAYPVLVHCTAGKDRTGVLIGLLMDLLGASPDDIAAEYGLSTASVPALLAYLEATGRRIEGTPEEVAQRLATPPERMAGFLTLLRERYGGTEPYLRAQGIAPATLSAVRRILTA